MATASTDLDVLRRENGSGRENLENEARLVAAKNNDTDPKVRLAANPLRTLVVGISGLLVVASILALSIYLALSYLL